MSHETPNHFEATSDQGTNPSSTATSTSTQPVSSTNQQPTGSSYTSSDLQGDFSSREGITSVDHQGDHPSQEGMTSSDREGQFATREGNWAPGQRPVSDLVQDDEIRRGSGSADPLSLTAASERINQKNESYAEHKGSMSQNAPGKAGSIGEAAVGALGFGGSTVERPKEDQGLGEKIVNFFGA